MEEIGESQLIESAPSKRTQAWLKSESAIRTADLLAGAIAITLIFWWLQYSTSAICCGDYDGYYHIKWARLLWDNLRGRHFPPAFPWLPLTTLNPRAYVDHHLLYHIILIPFSWFRDMQTGAKVSAILFASLAVFSCYWLVVRYEIRYRLVWLLAILACSAPFLYRMNMAKAPPFTIIFLILGTYLLFEKKFWQLLPLAFVFTLTYDMVVLLLLAVIIWMIVIGWSEERFEWKPVVFVVAGIALGLIINPYFPRNLALFYTHARMKLTTGGFSTKVGGEWYPYDTSEFILNCFVALAAMLIGYLVFDFSDRKRAQRPLYFLALATALLLMNAHWKRFAEYFPPFAILFAAFALESFWQGRALFSRLPQEVLDDLQPFFDRQETAAAVKEKKAEANWQLIKAIVVSVGLAASLYVNVARTSKDIHDSDPRDHYAKGALWMRANVPPGEMVFNTDWDDFPRLFYYDPTHVYTSGLDPSYLHEQNSELSDMYVRITTGEEEDPGPIIRDKFGARWVFSDNTRDHDSFYDRALASGWFDRVYEDADCSVLHLRDQKATPPPEDTKDDKDKPGDDDNSAP